MAISKILYIGDCGSGYAGKHLKQALDYIVEDYKTGQGRWVSSLNCQPDSAYEQMRQTKVQFDKTDKRQGYHLIISFAEGEVDAETAFEVIGNLQRNISVLIMRRCIPSMTILTMFTGISFLTA